MLSKRTSMGVDSAIIRICRGGASEHSLVSVETDCLFAFHLEKSLLCVTSREFQDVVAHRSRR